VKRFDQFQLAETPFNSVAYSSDRHTFVMMAPNSLSVVIKARAYFWRPNFRSMLYKVICNTKMLC